MEWFYSVNDERHGPVSASELLSLHNSGVISDSSLVWAEQFSDWKPFKSARLTVSQEALAADPNLVECAVSGKMIPRSDALEYGENFVLPEHKNEFVQRLEEGNEPTHLGIANLRDYGTTLNLSSVLARAWDIYKSNVVLLALVHLSVWLLLDQIVAYADATIFSGEDLQNIRRSFNLERALEAFIGIIATVGIFHVCIAYSENRSPQYTEAMNKGLKLWGKAWVANFLMGLIIVGVIIAIAVPVAIGAAVLSDAAWFIAIPLGLAGICLLFWIFSRMVFVFPFLVETESSASEAIGKSFRLTKGHVFRIIGYGIVSFAIVFIPLMLPFVPTFFVNYWPTNGLAASISGIAEIFLIVFNYAFYKQLRISLGEDGLNH